MAKRRRPVARVDLEVPASVDEVATFIRDYVARDFPDGDVQVETELGPDGAVTFHIVATTPEALEKMRNWTPQTRRDAR
jgi:hypothetical protein